MKVNLSEIFYSIQGEGQLIGVPSTFVRFSGCPLRCLWCDTPYTSWEAEENYIDLSNLIDKIDQYKTKYIVITGGEPYLQKQQLIKLCQILKEKKYHITIETAGIIFCSLEIDLLSISPKLSNSIPISTKERHLQEKNRLQLNVLKKMINETDFQLKFVIEYPQDFTEVLYLQRFLGVKGDKIYLMPQAKNQEELQNKQEWVIDLCKEWGYRYSTRLHIDIWGNKRGI